MTLKLENSRTFENLRDAFLAEASLAFRLRYFTIVAEFEGLDRFAALFREYSENGDTHVHGCLDLLRAARDPSSGVPIGGSRQNLESALQTAVERSSQSYPEMARVAREEGFTDIASWFDTLEKYQAMQAARLRELGRS